ncbi:MAG: hypothetical protein KF729_34430 [Sandaracinaceae bacterium]|nr:hypothetical protein [Sandaracinaceae bacterium]
MSDVSEASPEELLRTLDEAALARVKVPTEQEIRAALERSREQFRKASEAPRPSALDPRLRYR